jgi:HEAT repeat protein
MPTRPLEPERAPEQVERFVKQLLVVYKAAKLYPPASEIPRESASGLLRSLHVLLREAPDLVFQVTKDGLLYNALPVLPELKPFKQFARECYNRHLSEIRFHSGATTRDVIGLCRVLFEPPEQIAAAGGIEQRLWDLQVDGVTVRTASTKIVDTELDDVAPELDPEEQWPPSFQRIDELVDAAYGARPRDQRLLVRFVQNPRLVARYLGELASSGRGGRPLTNLIAGRVVSMAHAASAELAEDQPAIYRAIAEALLGLDPETRRGVLAERLLPDARVDETVASVMRQFEIGELCKALVEGLSPDPVSRDGLSRALRNLAVISMQPKELILEAAGEALAESGMDGDSIATILENASPTQIRRPESTDRRDLESIIRLVDLAPVAEEAETAETAALRAEVADGISDSDVLLTLVTLVSIERRPEVFASLMGMLEDGLGLLLEWGEFGEAADAVSMLAAVRTDPTVEEQQRTRVDAALRAMAQPRAMREVVMALRYHHRDSPEAESCRRLLSVLGGHSIAPLLEVLADEPDMAARKSLVDLISMLAPGHADELAAKITDPRWYFVRNVVAILGATRERSALPPLARTLRHSDPRVRRETIRAAAGIKDKLAEEMLVAALSDDDPQNVALAARYLGTLGLDSAVPHLASLALGEGRGSADPAARIEAVESLGRLGTPAAAEALRRVLRQRSFLGGGRSREIRTAAESALAGIEHASGMEER